MEPDLCGVADALDAPKLRLDTLKALLVSRLLTEGSVIQARQNEHQNKALHTK